MSALIHAATMVTAGFIWWRGARCCTSWLGAMVVVLIVGLLTALLASIALVQTDIKRVWPIQPSVSSYVRGVWGGSLYHRHLPSGHMPVSKPCCFWAPAASSMPSTASKISAAWGPESLHADHLHDLFVASLAIAGVFPFAGFFSKDEILWAALTEGNFLVWLLAAIVAVMTSFYMFRLVFLVFHRQPSAGAGMEHHPHEAPSVMRVPLMILAGLSVVAGFIGIPIIEGAISFELISNRCCALPLPPGASGHALHARGWSS